MGRKKDIADTKRSAIVTLLKTKQFTYREIATKENVSAATVHREAIRLSNSGSPRRNRRHNCRRIRKTTARDDRKIRNMALQHRRAPAKIIVDHLKDEGINISEKTFRRRMYEQNLKCRRPAKKPKLTVKMKQRRFTWAQMHCHYTVDDWNKVV